jgi:ATP/maltotriose-dependent transcriptional regulator MalT
LRIKTDISTGDRQALHELAINLRSNLIVLPGGVVCAERLRRLISRVPAAPFSLLRAADLFLSGMVRLIRGDLPAAYDDFAQAMRLTEQLGALSQLSLETVLWLARSAALLNDFDTANQYADRLIALLDHPTLAAYRQAWGALYTSTKGWSSWLEGRYDEARKIADTVEAIANAQEWPVRRSARRMMRSLIRLTDGDFTAAERVLHDAYMDQQHFRDSASFGSAGLLLAYVYLQLGRAADTLAILDDVLALHEQQDTPGLMLLTGAPVVVPLLRLAVAHDLHAPFAARTLGLLPRPAEPPAQPEIAHNTLQLAPADDDTLTAREVEVLRLIALGASNGEIAGRLIISVATVKKHINNIFAKLHAQSRTQALVRARERGLL